MECARIAIFEDNKNIRERLAKLLMLRGHSVVLQATNLVQARERVRDLPDESLDVAIVDGNLGPDSRGCKDGVLITQLVKQRFGDEVKVIAYSGEGEIVGADIQFGKGQGPIKLIELISKI